MKRFSEKSCSALQARANAQPALLDVRTHKDWRLGDLQPFSYDFLMVDPPWHFANYSAKGQRKSATAHYETMTLEQIKALPVGALARSDAVLMLWITAPLLLDADQPGRSPIGEVLASWGFRYGSVGGWIKKGARGGNMMGTGYVLRSGMELFVLATCGSPQHSRGCLNHFEGLRRQHSRKPDSAYEFAEKYMPGKRYVELFSRQSRPGWDSWGLEAGKFDEQVQEELV